MEYIVSQLNQEVVNWRISYAYGGVFIGQNGQNKSSTLER